jgi:hypothetical protein
LKQGDETRIFSTGKVVYTLYPEIYFKFVKSLHNEHDDIMRAMQLAKVSLSDGTAIDFLNLLLGTAVTRETPMEIGYATWYDAMNMRVKSRLAAAEMAKVAAQFKDHSLFPTRSDPSKPIFDDDQEKQ